MRAYPRSLISLVIIPLLTLFSGASLANDITLRAELGQNSYLAEKGGKTYLRLDLEGLRHEEIDRTPVNIAIVIDKSGSMNGAKIEQAKEAAIMAVERLNRDDYVSIVTYSDRVDVLIPATPVHNHRALKDRIRAIRSRGRTALYAGTKQGIDELDRYLSRNRVNRVILLSDGLANVGPSSPAELEELGRRASERGISITTIGLGLGFNEDLMTKLAYASDGNHAFVRHERDLVDIFNKEFGDVLSVVAQDVEIIIECHISFRPIRVLGRKAEINGQKIRIKLNQLYAAQEKQIVIEAEIAGNLDEGDQPYADIDLDYRSMKQKSRVKLSKKSTINLTRSKDVAEKSLNKRVMNSVIEQIATEQNERAVELRDKGKIKEAKKVLRSITSRLEKEADRLGAAYAPALKDLAKKNKADAESLEDGRWNENRKAMRARQHKYKTQQSY